MQGKTTQPPTHRLLLVTLSLWALTVLSIGLLFYRGFEGTCLKGIAYAGASFVLLSLSVVASDRWSRQVEEASRPPSDGAETLRGRLRRFATTRWLAWDSAFGVLVPLIFLVIDPWVFKSAPGMSILLPEYRSAAYLFVIQNAAILAVWMLWQPERGALGFSGALFGGAAGAFGLGFFLLPLSIPFMFILGGGLLGFVPFVTAMTFIRRGRRAWAIGRRQVETGGSTFLPLLVGALVAVGPGVLLQLANGGFVVPRSVARMWSWG